MSLMIPCYCKYGLTLFLDKVMYCVPENRRLYHQSENTEMQITVRRDPINSEHINLSADACSYSTTDIQTCSL